MTLLKANLFWRLVELHFQNSVLNDDKLKNSFSMAHGSICAINGIMKHYVNNLCHISKFLRDINGGQHAEYERKYLNFFSKISSWI